jgi:transketolase
MAANILSEEGIDCGVISMHTLRPFDEAAVLDAALNSTAIITVEEHSIHGGLGSLCASLLLQRGVCSHFKIIGIPDEYTITGSQAEIFEHYGITPQGLAQTAKQIFSMEVR